MCCEENQPEGRELSEGQPYCILQQAPLVVWSMEGAPPGVEQHGHLTGGAILEKVVRKGLSVEVVDHLTLTKERGVDRRETSRWGRGWGGHMTWWPALGEDFEE